jgi:hypothetical protein
MVANASPALVSGVIVYYTNNPNPGSLGGFDIFVSPRGRMVAALGGIMEA